MLPLSNVTFEFRSPTTLPTFYKAKPSSLADTVLLQRTITRGVEQVITLNILCFKFLLGLTIRLRDMYWILGWIGLCILLGAMRRSAVRSNNFKGYHWIYLPVFLLQAV